MEHFQLNDFAIKIRPNGIIVVLITGQKKYLEILQNAFPEMRFSTIWVDIYDKYDWGVFINDVDNVGINKIKKLLELFCSVVCINDILSQTFALKYHIKPDYNDGGRTDIGELVFQAKYRNSMSAALTLTDKFQEFITCHPAFLRSDYLVYVPYYGERDFSLPKFVTENLGQRLRISLDGQPYIQKIKDTRAMKDLTNEQKFENISGAFKIQANAPFKGKIITIIDDLYQSGTTLHELATQLQKMGASVNGLIATKTFRD